MTRLPTAASTLGRRHRASGLYHSDFPGLASMTKGVSCSLAIREDVEEEPEPEAVEGFSFSPTWANDGWPCLAMMTGLSEDVFLPSGQIALGRVGLFYGLRYSGLENKQAANETFLWNWHK